MARKQAGRKTSAAKKSTPKKRRSPTKTVTKKKKKRAASASAAKRKSKPAKAPAAKKRVVKKSSTRAALGRPRVAGTAELELMFRKDLEAREIFEFLGVKTLKDLETLSPDQIVQQLTAPLVQTVERIRKALAMNNRCLEGDQKFALAFKKQVT